MVGRAGSIQRDVRLAAGGKARGGGEEAQADWAELRKSKEIGEPGMGA
jgi:hypothetical protein